MDTSVLLRCYYALFSHPWVLFSCEGVCCWMSSSASRAPGVFGGQTLPIWLSCRFVIDAMLLHTASCTRLIRTRIIACSVSSICFCQSSTYQRAHPLEFEVSMYKMSQFARYFLPAYARMWNDLHFTVVNTGTLDGFKGAVHRWLLPWVCFSVFLDRMCLYGCVSNL